MAEGLISYAWTAVWSVAAPWLLGIGVVRWLGLAANVGWRVTLGFAYLAGHLLLAVATVAWLAAGKPCPGVLLPAVGALLGAWTWRRHRSHFERPRASAATSALNATTVVVVAAFLTECVLWNRLPIFTGDEALIWAAKAKVLHESSTLDLATGLQLFVSHPDYPDWNPLVQVGAFASAGRVLHFENRLPIQFFGVAMLLLLSGIVARRCHAWLGCLVLVAFAGTLSTCLATSACADTMLAFATLALVEAIVRWRETGDRLWWRTACLAATAMLATKNEGSMLLLVVAAPWLVWWIATRRRSGVPLPRREIAWLLLPLAAVALHHGFNAWYDLRNDLFDPTRGQGTGLFARLMAQAPANVPDVLAYFWNLSIDPSQHRLLPLAFVVVSLIAWWQRGRQWIVSSEGLTCITVLLAFGGYMLVFVGTHNDLHWHLATAAARTSGHVVGVAAMGLCTVLGRGRDHAA